MRSKKIVRNTVAVLSKNYISAIFSFICRTIFISILGETYLGVNGLFSNIFSMLSLAELGIGTSIIYFLYEPLAKGEQDEISGLLSIYKNLYRLVAVSIGTVGVVIIPWLPKIVNSTTEIEHLSAIYILLLADVVVSYLSSYKRVIFEADQKNFINNYVDLFFSILMYLAQIVVLLTTGNYLLYLLIFILRTVLSNIILGMLANKKYPYITNNNKYILSKEKKQLMGTKIAAAFSHRIGAVMVFSTDNILINFFENINVIGLYSNYTVILSLISSPLAQIFNTMTATIGNLNVVEHDSRAAEESFNKVFFLNNMLYSMASICLLCLLNDFITIWIGKRFIFSSGVIAVIIINFYMTGIKLSGQVFNTSSGLFWNTRFKPLAETIINLAFSVILGYKFGLIGVLLGTTCANFVGILVDPYVLYKNWFKSSSLNFFWTLLKYCVWDILLGIITVMVFKHYSCANLIEFFIKAIGMVSFLSLAYIAIYWKNSNLKYLLSMGLSYIHKK